MNVFSSRTFSLFSFHLSSSHLRVGKEKDHTLTLTLLSSLSSSLFISHLRVGKEKGHTFVLRTRPHIHLLQIFLQIVNAIRRRNHDLEQRVVAYERRQAR